MADGNTWAQTPEGQDANNAWDQLQDTYQNQIPNLVGQLNQLANRSS